MDGERGLARHSHAISDVPYDDVWLGMALATDGSGDGLTAVHMGSVAFAEGIPGLYHGPYVFHSTSLAWHNGHSLNKMDAIGGRGDETLARRIESVHALAAQRHCDSPNVTVSCMGKVRGAACYLTTP